MDGKEGGRGERVEGSKELERRKSKDEKNERKKRRSLKRKKKHQGVIKNRHLSIFSIISV